MKDASRRMYNIGNIVNIISLALFPLLFLVAILLLIIGGVGDYPSAVDAGWKLFGYSIYWTIIAILCFIFVGKAKKELQDESSKNFAPYIITIVFGALSWFNVFYVLAGIFGIIAESQQGNNANTVEAKPVEENNEPKDSEEPKVDLSKD